jgi:hypothetical protein
MSSFGSKLAKGSQKTKRDQKTQHRKYGGTEDPPHRSKAEYQVFCLREVGNFQPEAETLPRSDLRQRIRETRAKRRLTAVVGVGSGWRVRTGRKEKSVATPEASGDGTTARNLSN